MNALIAFLIRFVPRPYLQRLSGLGLKVLGLFYRGKGTSCPICGTSYRHFLPYGRVNSRANALCPNCLSLERHRLLWLYLKDKAGFFDHPQKVLHIAPEACFISRFEKQHGEGYITADIESPLAKVKMDIHHIPFEEGTFDVVLCNHVLEHVKDDYQALREIHRALKPGGYAILQVPFINPIPEITDDDPTVTSPREREKRFGQTDHVRKYGRDYAQRIGRVGFTVTEDMFIHSFSDAERRHWGLARGEMIYRADKR